MSLQYDYYYTPNKFFLTALIGVFFFLVKSDWQISKSLLNTGVDLKGAAVWTTSILPLISYSSNLLYELLENVSRIASTIGLMFYIFFSFLARSKYLSIFSLSFIFTLWFAENQVDDKVSFGQLTLCIAYWHILICVYTIGSCCQILISCKIPSGSSFPSTHGLY